MTGVNGGMVLDGGQGTALHVRPWHAPALPRVRTMLAWVLAAGLAVVFVSGYTAPFSSNQNIYFLHGLAATGYGHLGRDWLTAHAETFPLFSWLIAAMYWPGRAVGDALAFLFYVLSCGVYGLAILLICRRLDPRLLAPQILLPFLTLLAVFHSHALARVTHGLTALPVLGVAMFYPLGGIFQPQAFAVLLLLGIAAFLWARPFWGAALVAAASALHPAFLPCGGFAVLGMLIAHRRAGMPLVRIFLVGVTACLIVLPEIVYVLTTFAAADPEMTREVHRLLVEVRGPHHMLLSRWLLHPVWGIAPEALFKFLLCAAAIVVVRRTPLFWVLLACVGGMWLLTLVYAVTGNHSLGAAYPWRGFALIVPLSTAIVVLWALGGAARMTDAGSRLPLLRRLPPAFPAPQTDVASAGGAADDGGRHGNAMAAAFIGLARMRKGTFTILTPLALCVIGAGLSVSDNLNRFPATRDLHAFVRANVTAADLYLVPAADLTMMSFRLETGAPVFVDLKTHPLTAEGFLEWYRRMRLAAPVFDGRHRLDCARLHDILQAEPAISHVVSADRDNPCTGLRPALTKVYSGRQYSVWKLSGTGRH